MRGGLRTLERVVHGETQGGHAGRAWCICLADTRGCSHETKRRDFRPVAQTETNCFKATTVGSLLQCVHTLQVKLRGRPRQQALLQCASIQIRLGWVRHESRECGVQFFFETRSSDPIHTHSNICIALGVRVASECCARATPWRHVYTGGRRHHLARRTESRTIQMFGGNNQLACPLNYERHSWRDSCRKVQEYVT